MRHYHFLLSSDLWVDVTSDLTSLELWIDPKSLIDTDIYFLPTKPMKWISSYYFITEHITDM